MAYTYALSVIRRRTSDGQTAFAGCARTFAVTSSTARWILDSLDLGKSLDFIESDPEITSVQVDRQKIASARVDLKKQIINGTEFGHTTNYSTELGELLAIQRELLADPEARVFLEID